MDVKHVYARGPANLHGLRTPTSKGKILPKAVVVGRAAAAYSKGVGMLQDTEWKGGKRAPSNRQSGRRDASPSNRTLHVAPLSPQLQTQGLRCPRQSIGCRGCGTLTQASQLKSKKDTTYTARPRFSRSRHARRGRLLLGVQAFCRTLDTLYKRRGPRHRGPPPNRMSRPARYARPDSSITLSPACKLSAWSLGLNFRMQARVVL